MSSLCAEATLAPALFCRCAPCLARPSFPAGLHFSVIRPQLTVPSSKRPSLPVTASAAGSSLPGTRPNPYPPCMACFLEAASLPTLEDTRHSDRDFSCLVPAAQRRDSLHAFYNESGTGPLKARCHLKLNIFFCSLQYAI